MLPFTLLQFLAPITLSQHYQNYDHHQIPLQASDQTKYRFNSSYFDETIASFIKARSIPALSVALTYDDRLIYASAFGYASKENDLLATPNDRFRLASVSKSITAIAILHLVDLGALDLTERVFGNGSILGSSYGSKTFSTWERQITVQHLLEHTSGYVNDDICGEKCDPTYLPKFIDLDQWKLISKLLDLYDPTHEPGTFTSYSNFAYFILGRIVEVYSGTRNYSTYVRDVILNPLNITRMETASDDRTDDDITYYDFQDAEAPYSFHVSRRDSVGAWTATPTDLVKILTAINGLPGRPDFLSPSTRSLMFTKSPLANSSFAKGWTVILDSNGTLIEAVKDGDYPGTNAYWSINFVNKTSYAIAVNREIEKGNGFNGAFDLKTLMDNLTSEVVEWPEWDYFKE
jgi:CubicO group peptidase (beta-lactamase class C family)